MVSEVGLMVELNATSKPPSHLESSNTELSAVDSNA